MSEPNCEVTGKRKYLSEREALDTATHQLTLPNAPKESHAPTSAPGAKPGTSPKTPGKKE